MISNEVQAFAIWTKCKARSTTAAESFFNKCKGFHFLPIGSIVQINNTVVFSKPYPLAIRAYGNVNSATEALVRRRRNFYYNFFGAQIIDRCGIAVARIAVPGHDKKFHLWVDSYVGDDVIRDYLMYLVACDYIPYPNCFVIAATDEVFSVCCEFYTCYCRLMPEKTSNFTSGTPFPYLDGFILATGSYIVTIGAGSNADYSQFMAFLNNGFERLGNNKERTTSECKK